MTLAIPGKGDMIGPMGDNIGPDGVAGPFLKMPDEPYGLIQIFIIRKGSVVHMDGDNLYSLPDHKICCYR